MAANSSSKDIPGVFITENLESIGDRELGTEAVFTISSAKPGNGVEQLRDDNADTYWQSDGTFPHFVNIQFSRKVCLSKVCLYLDYTVDESYTPKKVGIAIGSCAHDLIDIFVAELQEPTGWVVFDLSKAPLSHVDTTSANIRAHLLQVKVMSMHQNGKDTHIRQLKVFGRREAQKVMANLYHDDFKTIQMSQFCVLR